MFRVGRLYHLCSDRRIAHGAEAESKTGHLDANYLHSSLFFLSISLSLSLPSLSELKPNPNGLKQRFHGSTPAFLH
jgi:hypothetical protein